MPNPFERYYKCEVCGEVITEEWSQGASTPSTSTIHRMLHLFKHNFKEVEEKDNA